MPRLDIEYDTPQATKARAEGDYAAARDCIDICAKCDDKYDDEELIEKIKTRGDKIADIRRWVDHPDYTIYEKYTCEICRKVLTTEDDY